MGMFDTFKAPFKCDKCGYSEDKHGWQSKDLDCYLECFELGAEINRHYLKASVCTLCPECEAWHEGPYVIIKDGIWTEFKQEAVSDGQVE